MHALLQVVLLLVLVGLVAAAVMSGRRRRQRAQRDERRAQADAKAKATAKRQAIEDAARRQVAQVRREDSAVRQARETVESAASRRAAEEAARAQVARRAAAEAALSEAGRFEAERSRAARAAAPGAAELAAAAVADAARREGELLAQRRRDLERDAQQRQGQSAQPAERRALERPAAEVVKPLAAGAATAPKSPENTVVMIADDSKVVRIKTGRLLAQHRYKVALATDGVDAAHQIQAKLPDVVIIDVEMPGMDGFQLTRRLRRNPATAHIPIIMITSADDKYRESAKRSGVDVLMGKPYSEDALIGHIRSAMSTPLRARQPEMA